MTFRSFLHNSSVRDYLVRRPCRVFLDIPPARKEGITLRVLGVVLANNNAVAKNCSVLVTEIVLPEPDGDGVHAPRHLRGVDRPHWLGRS